MPALRYAAGKSARSRFLTGFVFGALTFASINYWHPVAIVNGRWLVNLSLPAAVSLALLAWVASSVILGIHVGVAFVTGLPDHSGQSALSPFRFAVWFTGLEWLRTLGPLGYTWGILGLSQRPWSSLIQSCDLIGVHGLTFLIALTNAAFALPAGKALGSCRWGVAGLVAILCLRGSMRSREADSLAPSSRVALIQPAFRLRDKLNPQRLENNLRILEALSRQAASEGARLIVWPETVIPAAWSGSPEVSASIQRLAVELGSDLILGTNEQVAKDAPLYNQAVLVTTEGTRGFTRKSRLVPFGEYTPLRRHLSLLRRLSPEGTDYSPGAPGRPLATAFGDAGVLICFESTFSDGAQRLAKDGAEYLVVITNDDWFLGTSAVADHADFAVFRAIETRRWLVQVANSGQTFIVNPAGHIVEGLPLGQRDFLVGSIPRLRHLTFQVRVGDWVPVACLLTGILLLASEKRRRTYDLATATNQGSRKRTVAQ